MLIGLTGMAGSGKDTVFEMIEDTAPLVPEFRNHEVYRDAFADRLKISAAKALGFKDEDPYECVEFCNDLKWAGKVIVSWDNERLCASPSVTSHWVGWEITGREFLQLYGTEAHRDVFDKDFWINAVLPEPKARDLGRDDYDPAKNILVVTDVRFDNEADRVRECGGHVWWIIRDAVNQGDIHASERPIDPSFITDTIYNNSSLAALRQLVGSLLMQAGTHPHIPRIGAPA